ncbi:zf-HC2 domain-containing protein [Rubrivirga sp. IMCC43871]|uniref:zf-HC2 domain-containing protein n=1 Tax=Rubrivirga sp. IMCC43871 TaxID=3391575 RepID=UPI0039900AC4
MTDCTRIDAYRDGRLAEPDAQAFETHAATCDACDAALLADDLGLSALADIVCPPEVLDAALAAVGRSTRRAGDRAAAPASRAGRTLRRFQLVPLSLAAALALAATVWLLPREEATAPDIARVEAPVPGTETTQPLPSPDTSEIPEATPPATAPAPAAAQPSRPTSPPRPVPATTPVAPSPDLIAATEPATDGPPDEVSEPEPSAADVAAARRELALAFALVADVQTQARDAIRDDASALTSTLDTALPF